MKITLEPFKGETQVIIRGDISGKEVENILKLLNSSPQSNKLILFRDDEQYIINLTEILFFKTSGNKVTATTTEGIFDTKMKLYELKEMLCTQGFSQINKSTLVNINYVKSVQAEFSGNYTIRLKNCKKILIISRKFFKEFKESI